MAQGWRGICSSELQVSLSLRVMIADFRHYRFIISCILSASLVPLAFLVAPLAASSLTLVWDPNREDDLAVYKVYYGVQSRDYDVVIDVGNVTQYTATALEPGTLYYCALTAYDTSGNESDFSAEVSSIVEENPLPEPPPNPPLEVVKVTSPNGGETLISGTNQTIAWETYGAEDLIDSVKLLFTKNDRRAWKEIAVLAGNPGSYGWTVPEIRKTKSRCRVMVILRDASGNIAGSDASDGRFTIQP